MSKWNKCQICGRFISYQDISENKAKHNGYYTSDGEEAFDTYHLTCLTPLAAREDGLT